MSETERLAEAAKNILRTDEELNGFSLIRENIINQWEASSLSDTEGREECFRMLHTLKELQRYLRKTVDDGKIEVYRKEIKE